MAYKNSWIFYRFKSFLKETFSFVFCLIIISILFYKPSLVNAKLQITKAENGYEYTRSLESLRDLDYETWQLVVYPKEQLGGDLVLRIVGYPGTLRFDHPSALKVYSGRREWYLDDITLSNKKLANDPREAAAEFTLSPLLEQLNNNRPLRFVLKGVFAELPIPPYLVSEWRSIIQDQSINEGV